MSNNEPIRSQVNQRKGKDLILKLIDLAGVILWVILLVNIGIILESRPQAPNFFDKLFHVKVRDYWDAGLLSISLVISIIELTLSLFSLYLNSKRLKRRYDRIRVSIIISLFASLIISIFLSLYLFS
ncbi:MAG: hypothetical protein N2376_01965 [Clostridia bacterium]|nr:hypothetical protein [Clostridia bacterium]